MDRLPLELQGGYACDFRLADEAFHSGRLEVTAQGQEVRWQNWCAYVKPLGVDPYLDHTPFQTRLRCLTRFAQQTQTGLYGQQQQVHSSTVSQAILVVGQTIALACNYNLTKVIGSKKFLPALQVMLDGYSKSDSPARKMLPIEADVPNLLVEMGYGKGGTAHSKAIGNLSMIVFYYLLRIGEYTIKRKQNNKKQTVQFKLEDVYVFKKNKMGTLVCLPRTAPVVLLLTADSATLKLDNQKNGWKGVYGLCTSGSKWRAI